MGRTRLYQAPGSPLIQGHSKTERPWWQPVLLGCLVGLVWPLLTMWSAEVTGSGGLGTFEGLAEALRVWVDVLWLLVPSVLFGAVLGNAASRAWGIRFRWIPASVGAVLMWYAALLIRALVS